MINLIPNFGKNFGKLHIGDLYRIAGFFCEVLICANYARRCGLADFIIADITAGLKNYAKRCGLADFIIADITAGLKNCMFAEIAPRRKNPLYGILYAHTNQLQ